VNSRTLSTKTFDNGDGTFTLEAHPGHVHYVDRATGELKDCDTTLVDAGDKWLQSKASYHCEIPKHADGSFAFADVFDGKNQTMVMRPLAQPVRGEMDNSDGWVNKRVLYRNAYGKGLHLRVTAGNTGLLKEIIIDEMPAPLRDLSFDFEVSIPSEQHVYVLDAGIDGRTIPVLLANLALDGSQTLLIGQNSAGSEALSSIRQIRIWDSDGNAMGGRLEFYKKDSKLYCRKVVPKEFLAEATYPVYTDDTATYTTGSGDGYLEKKNSPDWDTTHNATTAPTVNYTTSNSVMVRTGKQSDGDYVIERAFFPFNTSALPDTAPITGASLSLYVTAKLNGDNDGEDFFVVVQTSQAADPPTSLTAEDYDQCGSLHSPVEGSDRVDVGSIVINQYNTWTMNATGLGWISKTGYTKLGMREGHDILDHAYGGANGTKNRITGNWAEYSGTAMDPKLSVDYIPNSRPTLDWLGSGGYSSDGVEPDSAPGGANFEFRVKYTDADGEAPATKEVWVDVNDNGNYEAGEMFDMAWLSGGDYTQGVEYTASMTLSQVGDGHLLYRFYFHDGEDPAAQNEPAGDHMSTVANNAPALDWTGTTGYQTDGVEPPSGDSGATFEFRVKYTDADGEAPEIGQVWVDLNDSGFYAEGEKFDMTFLSGNDYASGVEYTKPVPINYAGDGTLKYRFYFSDWEDEATGHPALDDSWVFSINLPPIFTDGTGHATHFMSPKGPQLSIDETGCYTCHADALLQCQGTGPVFIDELFLDQTHACDNCHSAGGAFDGVTMAKANWDEGVYEADGTTLKTGMEKWCVTCHDGATSECYGVSAPNVDLYYTSGHGRPSAEVECLVCHDATFVHTDGEPRTYAFSYEDLDTDGTPDMYEPENCGVAYAAGYRLRYVGQDVPLMIPASNGVTFGWDEELMKSTAFRRCFASGCHDTSQLFDLDWFGFSVVDTNFTDRPPNPPRYYSMSGWDPCNATNEHYNHVLGGYALQWDSDWDIWTGHIEFGEPESKNEAYDASYTCSTCHNVHGTEGTLGSTNEAMMRDGRLEGMMYNHDMEWVPRIGFGFTYLIEDTGAGGYPWVTSVGATQETSVGAVFRNDPGGFNYSCWCHDKHSAYYASPPPAAGYDASVTPPDSTNYLQYFREWWDVRTPRPPIRYMSLSTQGEYAGNSYYNDDLTQLCISLGVAEPSVTAVPAGGAGGAYSPGAQVILTAQEAPHWEFVSFDRIDDYTRTTITTDSETIVTMNECLNLYAKFQYTP
jgi:hypothetical protein